MRRPKVSPSFSGRTASSLFSPTGIILAPPGQENHLLADRSALDERDLVVLKISGAGVRALFGAVDGLDGEAIRLDLEAPEVGEFAAFLLGKDGTVKLRASEPITDGELFAIIDSMPMRAAESLKPDK